VDSSNVTPGLQEYLTSIYRLKKSGKKEIRIRDLAKERNVRLPSVTGAMKKLAKMNLVRYNRYGSVDLTEDGERIAEVLDRIERDFYLFLVDFLGVPEEKAREEACRVEHGINMDTAKRLVALMDYLSKCLPEEERRKIKEYIERRIEESQCNS
jgi:DtxR family Mn-dependent transcriptional regulator